MPPAIRSRTIGEPPLGQLGMLAVRDVSRGCRCCSGRMPNDATRAVRTVETEVRPAVPHPCVIKGCSGNERKIRATASCDNNLPPWIIVLSCTYAILL